MLTADQLALRENKITASFAPPLMAGDEARIHNKFLELIGDPSWTPEDLTGEWVVQFGVWIEPFALDWHERRTKTELTRRGEVVTHPDRPYVCATLDAWREADRCCIDHKAINSFATIDSAVNFYLPQLIVQRGCTRADRAALLITHGGAEPQEVIVRIDADYEALVWQRIDQFQHCVETLTPPVKLPDIVKPAPPPDQWRTIDLDKPDEINAHNWSSAIIAELT